MIAENRIVRAIRDGEFRNLRGTGKPISPQSLERDESGWWAAHHMLETAGLRPLWIELDLEIRRRQNQALLTLERNFRSADGPAERRHTLELFGQETVKINKLIDQLNAAVPSEHFLRVKMDPDRILSERGYGESLEEPEKQV